jgi:PAS domain-containing protein
MKAQSANCDSGGEVMAQQDLDYQRVFNALPGPMVLLTPEFVILDVNDAGLEATRRRSADLIGRDFFEAFPPMPRDPGEDPRPFLTSLNEVLASGEQDVIRVTRYDLVMPDNPGERAERYWTAINCPIRDDDQGIGMIACRVEDVTHIVMQSRALQAQH